MQNSILLPQNPSIYSTSTKEPQYITAKPPTTSWLYFDSLDTPAGTDRTNCTLGSGGIMASGFNRLKFIGMSLLWDIPNVNPRNNVIQFYSSNTGSTIHSCTLNVGFYPLLDSAALINAIRIAMNTVSGASGLTFSFGNISLLPRTYTLTAAGGTFYFYTGCSAITKGAQMYGLPTSQTLEATKTVGTMQMIYTQYVDVVSHTATKFQKSSSVSTKNIAPIVVRAYLGNFDWGFTYYVPDSYIAYAWQDGTPLYSVDFAFYDQNGDPLYAPNDGQTLKWQITLAAEY